MRKYTYSKYFKSAVALVLTSAMVLVSPIGGNLSKVARAEEKQYVSEVVLSYGKTEKDARSWLEGKGYKVVEGDLNAGTDNEEALKSKEANVVLMGYKTTTESSKAVRDMAVMNMSGSYEVTDMETIIKNKNKELIDQSNDFIELTEEYAKNYRIAVKSKAKGKSVCVGALKAHDMLNKFIEDDSKKGMGDYLLKNSSSDEGKDNIFKTFIQANSQTVGILKNILLLAGGEGDETWVEKLSVYNKDKTFFARIKKEKKTKELAKKYLDKKYGYKMDVVVEEFEKLQDRFEEFEENGKAIDKEFEEVDDDNEEEINETVDEYFGVDEKKLEKVSSADTDNMSGKELTSNFETYAEQTKAANDEAFFAETASIMTFLDGVKYADGTLLDFFNQDISEEDSDLKYECVAILEAMTDSQINSLGNSINLFTAIKYAMIGDEKIWNKLDNDSKDNIDEGIKNIEKISIYEGVRREMFKDSVAITQAGQTVNHTIFDEPYSDSAYNSIMLGVGSVVTIAGISYLTFSVANTLRLAHKLGVFGSGKVTIWDGFFQKINNKMGTFISKKVYGGRRYLLGLKDSVQRGIISEEELKTSLKKYVVTCNSLALSIGVALTAVGLYFSISSLCDMIKERNEYYKGDYSKAIPRFIVDLNYNEDEDAYFNYYEVAKCNRNEEGNIGFKREGEEVAGLKDYGDINGDSGKQWVALYYSTDEAAGDPILADSFEVRYGKNAFDEEYKELHSFNEPQTGFNLTSSVYCYNDKKNGTYLRYKVDTKSASKNTPASTGSMFSNNKSISLIVVSGIAGLLLGFVGGGLGKRRKEETNS
ncbi:MAG: hypothetical protein K6D02_06035 [Lachnospiraceae bacterium]|nr:hypothetical protein [Lachnospiraceae bacterium]